MPALVLILALLVAPEDAPKPGNAPPATRPGAAVAVASKTIVGEIVWVDFSSRLVHIRESVKTTAVKGKPATRETITLAVAPDVPVIRGKQPSTFSELKAKDHVVARYLQTEAGAKAVSMRVADASTGAPRTAADTSPVPTGTAGNAN